MERRFFYMRKLEIDFTKEQVKLLQEKEEAKIQKQGEEKYNPKAKARYFVAVLYPESMIPNWQDVIDDTLQVPYCYCIHDKDVLQDGTTLRKPHVHIMVAFNNSTTTKHALEVFNLLCQKDKGIKYCEMVVSVRNKYEYLIHNTNGAKKANKHLYDVSERISGNNFDIGAYEQLSTADKREMRKAIASIVNACGFTNFAELDEYVRTKMSDEYYDEFICHQGYFANLVRGCYNSLKTELSGETNFIEQLRFLRKQFDADEIGLEEYQEELYQLRKAYRHSHLGEQ